MGIICFQVCASSQGGGGLLLRQPGGGLRRRARPLHRVQLHDGLGRGAVERQELSTSHSRIIRCWNRRCDKVEKITSSQSQSDVLRYVMPNQQLIL